MRVSSFSVIIVFLVISLLGIFFIPLLPLKLSPSKQLPQASIYFTMRGSSSRVVETQVTSKMEAMINRIANVSKIKSSSGNGWGRIDVEIDKYADIDFVRFELATTIRQMWAQLPDNVSYPSLSLRSPNNDRRAFMTFSFNASTTPYVIKDFVEKNIRANLIDIKGLDNVNISGAMPMEWQLIFDTDILNSLNVKPADIQSAVQQELKSEFLGIVPFEDGDNLIRVVLMPNIDKNLDWTRVYVKNAEDKVFQLSQLVKINRQEQPASNYFRINGLNSIYMNLYADESSNQLELGKKVLERINEINLPIGYEIHKIYDATEYIKDELNKIYFRSILTLLILLLFVLIISRRWKYLLIIVLSLFANISVAFIFYYLFQLELQLYSLAGITISLTLIIDNTIVMTDHLLYRKNYRAFPAILAATLTTVAALSIVFFLNENIRLNLQDFSYVVIINLLVSLFVALLLVPALIERLKLNIKKRKFSTSRKRFAVKISRIYYRIICFMVRFKAIFLIIIVLIFGLPIFLLPSKIDEESKWHKVYTSTIGSDFYQTKLKNTLDKALGGTLRLFIQNVYEGSYFTEKERITVSMRANGPNGGTVEQMNKLVKEIEVYLSGFKEIEQFQTNINNARQANIFITFKEEYEHKGFPSSLKSMLISKAIELGGATWNVNIQGIREDGFNNNIHESAGSYQVVMYGYNYDDLIDQAENLKNILLKNRRIKEVNILPETAWYKDDYYEYGFRLNNEELIKNNIAATNIYNVISNTLSKDLNIGRVIHNNNYEDIKLTSLQSIVYDIWNLQNELLLVDTSKIRLKDVAYIDKISVPQKINKENQQYLLSLQYDYIGSDVQGRKFLDNTLEEFQKILPLGYSAKNNWGNYGWDKKDQKQYLYLALIILIIIFICSILFNSIKQSFSIISIIPISYIGIFLTFYLFSINFDQGGFASLILLTGITVNASIYIVNEMNSIRRNNKYLPNIRIYIKAWNAKLMPIFITTVSTILGFIPFILKEESFWFPLAAGTMGGLVFSWVGIIFYLPLILLKRKKKRNKKTLALTK